jgi:hypothetical protein
MEAQAVTDVVATTPHGWTEAFPGEDYHQDDRRAQLIDDLLSFLATPSGREILAGTRLVGTNCVLEVDLEQLLACPSDDLKVALDLQPAECLSCIVVGCTEVGHARASRSVPAFGCVAFRLSDHRLFRRPQAIFRDKDGQFPSCIKRELAAGTLKVRLFNHSTACVLIKDLKANCIGTPTLRGYSHEKLIRLSLEVSIEPEVWPWGPHAEV